MFCFQLTTHELKQGGDDIPVLEDNKHEYIELMVRWRLDRGVHEQNQALLKGFNEVGFEGEPPRRASFVHRLSNVFYLL